jgi:RimJ/RimL family protein N-acetyltransferase
MMTIVPLLRDVVQEDLAIFFGHQLDEEANHMAAFTAKDPTDLAAFKAHWKRILEGPGIIPQTIVLDGQVAGHIMSYEEAGVPEVTYWLAREYWGQGLATRALREFLESASKTRPIFARAAKDNAASLRVLEKCGFTIISEGKGFANARGAEIGEWLLELPETTAAGR